MHADIVCTVVISLDGKRIVKILSVNWIDGKDTLATKILANFELVLGDAVQTLISLGTCARKNVTYVQGIGGKHLRTLSVKSSVGKLQSLRRALVSTSMSPIGPSSSTKVPKG